MSKFLFFSLSLLLAYSANAQVQIPGLGWQKCVGGIQYDAAHSVIQTSDTGFLVACVTQSNDGDVTLNHGLSDILLVKLTSTGSISWKKTLGGSLGEQPTDLIQTKDGGYLISGYTTSTDGDFNSGHGAIDAFLLKLSSTGAVQWQKTYGGSGNDASLSVRQTSDTGYIMVGWSASSDGDLTSNQGNEDGWVLKLTATGSIVWQYSYGGTNEDHFTCVEQTNDGGYIVSGSTKSVNGDVVGNHGGEDVWLLKLTSTGAITWKYCYGGSAQEINGEHGYKGSVHQTAEGGYIFCAGSASADGNVTGGHGYYDFWVVKTTSTGAISWQKTYGGTGDDEATAIHQTPDHGYIVGGMCDSSNGNVSGGHGLLDAWVIKLDSVGNLKWQKPFGGPATDLAFDLQRTFNGNYVLVGYAGANGGDVSGIHGNNFDAWIATVDVITSVQDNPIQDAVVVSPNPANEYITVSGVVRPTLKLYNSLGQLVRQASASNGLSLAGMPGGIYFLWAYDQEGLLATKQKILKK